MNILKIMVLEHKGNSIQIFYIITYFPVHGTLHSAQFTVTGHCQTQQCATQTFLEPQESATELQTQVRQSHQDCGFRSRPSSCLQRRFISCCNNNRTDGQTGAHTHASICGLEPQQRSLLLKSVTDKTVISKQQVTSNKEPDDMTMDLMLCHGKSVC